MPRAELVPAALARRLLLGGQGLLDDPGRRATEASLQAVVEQLGFVQVDSINVVARAHHLTLLARLDGYRPELLAALLERRRSLFEHWTHDASVVPTRWFHHWHHRFARDRKRVPTVPWWRARLGRRPEASARKLLERLEREGALSASDLEGERQEHEPGGWWSWSPEKAALEYLWRTGRVLVARREGFEKVYQLPHRVLPEAVARPPSSPAEHREWALSLALDRLGVATPLELAAYLRAVALPEARAWVAAGLKAGRLVEVAVAAEGAGPARRAVAWPDWEARAEALPAAPRRTRLLSPFDPVVRDRRRALDRFGFDYRFEAFVPRAKRRFGYYVLPALEGEALVGRVDLKLDREAGALQVLGRWWEARTPATRARRAGLDDALQRLAAQLGAGKVT